MKKTICAILAAMLCMTVFFAGCGDSSSTTPGGVVDNAVDENIQSAGDIVVPDLEIQEGETTVEDDLGADVEVFLTNQYYLEGTIYSPGAEPIPAKLAVDQNKNFQFTTDYSFEDMKIAFGVAVLDGTTYMTLPEQKKYAELSDTLLAMLDMEDIADVSDFQMAGSTDNSLASISQYAVTINGEAGLRTVYTFEDTTFKLYSIGDRLIQIENIENNEVVMLILVDEISGQIPADQLSLKGLEKASPTSFFSALISAAGG